MRNQCGNREAGNDGPEILESCPGYLRFQLRPQHCILSTQIHLCLRVVQSCQGADSPVEALVSIHVIICTFTGEHKTKSLATYIWHPRRKLQNPFCIPLGTFKLLECLKRGCSVIQSLDVELIVTLVKRLANMADAFIHGLIEDGSIFGSDLLKAFTGAAVSLGASSTWAELHCLQANAILEPRHNRCFGYCKPPVR